MIRSALPPRDHHPTSLEQKKKKKEFFPTGWPVDFSPLTSWSRAGVRGSALEEEPERRRLKVNIFVTACFHRGRVLDGDVARKDAEWWRRVWIWR